MADSKTLKKLKNLVEPMSADLKNFQDLSVSAASGEHGARSAAAKARKLSLSLSKQMKEFRTLSIEAYRK